jgi:hypothetical protein
MQRGAGQDFVTEAEGGFIAAVDADEREVVGDAHHDTGQHQVQAGQGNAGRRYILSASQIRLAEQIRTQQLAQFGRSIRDWHGWPLVSQYRGGLHQPPTPLRKAIGQEQHRHHVDANR